MDEKEVMGKIIAVVRQVQETSGRPVGDINPSTRPIGDVPGFDSLNGVEASVILSESLGYELLADYNTFVSKDGRRALTVSEITDNLCKTIGGEAASK